MTLVNQRVVIIGGSSGMGLATARAAAAAGAVVTTGSADPERLKTALDSLPGNSNGAVLDASVEADVATFLSNVGEVDHLVYTANTPPSQRPLATLPLSEARQAFETPFGERSPRSSTQRRVSGRAARSC